MRERGDIDDSGRPRGFQLVHQQIGPEKMTQMIAGKAVLEAIFGFIFKTYYSAGIIDQYVN